MFYVLENDKLQRQDKSAINPDWFWGLSCPVCPVPGCAASPKGPGSSSTSRDISSTFPLVGWGVERCPPNCSYKLHPAHVGHFPDTRHIHLAPRHHNFPFTMGTKQTQPLFQNPRAVHAHNWMIAAMVVVYDLLHLAWFVVAGWIHIRLLHVRVSLVLIRLTESCQKVRL